MFGAIIMITPGNRSRASREEWVIIMITPGNRSRAGREEWVIIMITPGTEAGRVEKSV